MRSSIVTAMLNLLSYVGMGLQSELCFWTLLGLLRTIFDATLFKVNANLKQVWQMTMPVELSMPVQRGLRTMISGVMLVQCFTVYVYLASYIVLLYPIFLEERPTLVLPWLLLAAIRKFLCELTSLSLGLGVCLLVGPARPSCIRFVIIKIAGIIPAVYMWLLVLSYYNTLKVTAAFQRFPAVLPSGDVDVDYGLELAVRRRRTKSLMNERLLRRRIVANLTSYGGDGTSVKDGVIISRPTGENVVETPSSGSQVNEDENSTHNQDTTKITDNVISNLITERSVLLEPDDDFCESDLAIPRDTDRIMEQFILMLLHIGAYLTKQGTGLAQMYSTHASDLLPSTLLLGEDTDTPPSVGNDKTRTTSYLQQYPHIFMKKDSTRLRTSPPNSPDDSSKNLKRSENNSKLKISDKFIDFKPTFELKETPHQEVSEILLDGVESRNYREPESLKTDHNIRFVSSKEKVHEAVNISEVGNYERNKNNQHDNQYTEEMTSYNSFDEIIERITQSMAEKHNEIDRITLSNLSSQSSQSTLRENGSKHGNKNPKSASSDK
ncbi:uncharacterized protein LOC113228469 isoform X2 [Hyposmocoma kahamanoa]|uniref:uncharacterized protein LOC113228469 isoform X2 n=1 Tax=Hyposmocoma kahamanoa TaxID=1477025 RepID=UPI000E6D9A77|nr:uncharacterized protein LOC113228469 isoform X2 [Hyposmocoma kahamanoa]